MQKYYQMQVTREQYLKALRCGTGSTEEILTVLTYLRTSDPVLTYLRGHIGKEKFGRPVISIDVIGYIEERPLESTQAFFKEIDVLEEWLLCMGTDFAADEERLREPEARTLQPRSRRFAELANHHVSVYTEVYSFDDDPVPYDQMRYTEHVYFDAGSLIIEV